MSAGEKYVAAAYLVVFAFVLLYVLIIGAKLGRLSREVGEIAELVRGKQAAEQGEPPVPARAAPDG
jgi:CcmD family protein